MAHLGSTRASDKAADSWPSHHHHHHSRVAVDHRSLPSPSGATVDNRSLPEHHHHRRHEKDSMDHPGSTHVSRREIDCTVPAVLSGSNLIKGIILAQPGQVSESSQSISDGPRRRRSDRSGVMAGQPSLTDTMAS